MMPVVFWGQLLLTTLGINMSLGMHFCLSTAAALFCPSPVMIAAEIAVFYLQSLTGSYEVYYHRLTPPWFNLTCMH